MNKILNKNLIIFARYPEPGKVKTRLAATLGAEKTATLYRLFVEQTLKNMKKVACRKHLFFFPPDREAEIKEWLSDFSLELYPQCEGDLGNKMADAFAKIISKEPGKTLIIGTDSPDLPTEYISMAYTELDNNDVVLGPTNDGGYYLIGFAAEKFLPEAFTGIKWSTSAVFSQTTEILINLQKNFFVLPEWYDIDEAKDLKRLLNNGNTPTKIKDYLTNNCSYFPVGAASSTCPQS